MSFTPGVPTVSIGTPVFATSVPAVRHQPMMLPVRHVTLVPVSSVVMRPVMSNQTIHTISAPPRPQMLQTVSFNPMASVITHASIQQGPVLTQQSVSAEEAVKSGQAASGTAPTPGTPAVTVFVSNITERASDTLVRQILMKCGTVYAWKRVQGASGKLQAFGFCEYKDVEAALRAIYLLHDFKLGDKKLLVKVDAKTQDIINKWKEENGIKDPQDGSAAPPPNSEDAKAGLDLLMKEYAVELNTSVTSEPEPQAAPAQKIDEPMVRESNNVEENLKGLDLEDSEKDFISKEIRSFRAAQKMKEEEKKKEDERRKRIEKEKEDERERAKMREREREDREREKERERSRKNTRSPGRSRTPTRRREITRHSRSPQNRMRRRTPERGGHTRSPPRHRSGSRSIQVPPRGVRRTRSRSPRRREDGDEDDESYERRRLERKIREKEQAYQERLRAWEMRERRRKREYEKRDERDAMIRKEMLREAKRLQEFLADYDDMKMDPKYYTGGAMMKRRREWEREQDADNRDRKKEQEEIEALRQKLVEENHPDPEAAIQKAIKETQDVWQPLLKADTPPPKKEPPTKRGTSSSSSSSGSDSDSEQDEKSGSNSSDSDEESEREKTPVNAPRLVTANLVPVMDETPTAVTVASIKNEAINSFEVVSQNGNDTPDEEQSPKMGFYQQHSSTSDKAEVASQSAPHMISKPPQLNIPKAEPVMQLPGGIQRRKLKVSDVFNQDDDEEEVPKKRKLVPLEYTHEERNAINPVRSAEDKRKMVRALIEKIPTKKEDLFDFNLDWSMVDPALMEKRIQPWITKKIVEYIGEEEPTLVEFICGKIMSKSPPERIYEDVSMVLDDEAEVFVVKMWRLLIYETEAKKEGLTK